MSDDKRVGTDSKGFSSEDEEERAEEAQGGSEDEEQAMRESSDPMDTGGTK